MKVYISLPITGHDDAILDVYNQMVQCHWQLKDYRDAVSETFAQRLTTDPPPAFFEFFEITELKPAEEDTVIPIACTAIAEPDLRLSKSAALMVSTAIRKRKDPDFLNKWQSLIIKSVFKTLFDRRQVQMLRPVAKILYSIYKRQPHTSSVDEQVLSTLMDIIDEPDFCRIFAMTLRDSTPDRESFLNAMNDFLVTSGIVNPADVRLFLSGVEASAIAHAIISRGTPAIPDEDEFVSQ